METLQLGCGVLGKSAFTPCSWFGVEDGPMRMESVRMGSLNVTSSAQPLRTNVSGGWTWRHMVDIAGKSKKGSLVTVRATTMPEGLGESLKELKEGYVLKNLEIVDENAEVESTGDIIEKLKTGFKNFKDANFKQKPDLYAKLAQGQEPKVMLITCADSRVCPTLIHGLEAGEAFVVRNVANMVPPCEGSGEHHGTSAAVEFAVTGLKVEHIVVMGHSSCGGIKALMSRDDFSGDFVGSWVKVGLPAKQKTLSVLGGKSFYDQCAFCEKEAVNVSLANLLTFPFIEERVKAGTLQIHGMHYDFKEGKLTSWQIQREESRVPA